MISTRQLIFIISLVFFFVNRATSGSNASSSRTSYDNFSDVNLDAENSEDLRVNVDAVNSEDISDCKQEITEAFQGATPFDKFLFAFLHRNTAEFLEVNTIYSMAAYEYFKDLLSTAQNLFYSTPTFGTAHQPVLENPEQYCGRYHGQVDICLGGIAEIGCRREDSGVKCFEKLYLDWKKDESIVISKPIFGTAHLSDEDILTALHNGAEKYAGLPISNEDLAGRLSDENLLEEFCAQNENERRRINNLRSLRDDALSALEKARTDENLNPSYASSNSLTIANYNFDWACKHYIDLRKKYIETARKNCYGIEDTPYQNLLEEYTRRQNTNIQQQFGDSYATYLYDQIRSSGRRMRLDSKECKIFTDPENFCLTFLLNNPYYFYGQDR